MSKNITIMILSTIPDMIAEHYYFITKVFPQLRDYCKDYGINLEFVDMAFSMSDREISQSRSVRKYFQALDFDRTFLFCFRGQKLGRSPTYECIDKATLDEYPELVDYIGNTSLTELVIMHALQPFEKVKDGERELLDPVRHALFYFRDDKFLENLTSSQKALYTSNFVDEDEFVRDLNLAMAKDLIVSDKLESDNDESRSNISITKYEGIWDGDLSLMEVLDNYTREYASLNNLSYDFLIKISNKLGIGDFKGSFTDFKCDGRDLKDVMVEDFINELKLEFPDLFR